jgi:alpha-L-fucosidase
MKRMALVAFLCLFGSVFAPAQQEPFLKETPEQKAQRLQWWRDARFGLFIHWGPVSLKGTELSWSRDAPRRGIDGVNGGKGEVPVDVYDNLFKDFNPVKFNADEWVSIANAAGMKYMVLTAKHCDGFCLWNSKIDNYCMTSTPFKRDICEELAAGAHKAGMRIGWYYSPMDWRDPDTRTERNEIWVKIMQGHLRELLGNYGKIDLLWFDTDGGPAPWDQPNTYALVRTLQPALIINNRLDMGSLEDYNSQRILPNADYATPEQSVGAFNDQHPWETCMTIGTQWAWKPNDKIKTSDECIRILTQCVTGDGNLLLNVGPMPNGEIEPRQVAVLKEVGAWLGKYGESIYGTRGGPFRNGDWGGSTRKGSVVYLHIMKWQDGKVTLPPLEARIMSSTSLTGGNVDVKQASDKIVVAMTAGQQPKDHAIVKLQLDKPVATQAQAGGGPGLTRTKAFGAAVRLQHEPHEKFRAKGASSLTDGVIGSTNYAGGEWLGFEGDDFDAVLDLGKAQSIHEISLGYLVNAGPWIFEPLEVRFQTSRDGTYFTTVGTVRHDPDAWDSLVRVGTEVKTFAPVQARYVRVTAKNRKTCPSDHPGNGGKAWLFVDEILVE